MTQGKWKLDVINLHKVQNAYAALIDFEARKAVLAYNCRNHLHASSGAKNFLANKWGTGWARVSKDYSKGGPLGIRGYLRGASVSARMDELDEGGSKITQEVVENAFTVLAGLTHRLMPRWSDIILTIEGARYERKFPLDEYYRKFQGMQGAKPERRRIPLREKKSAGRKFKPKRIAPRRLR